MSRFYETMNMRLFFFMIYCYWSPLEHFGSERWEVPVILAFFACQFVGYLREGLRMFQFYLFTVPVSAFMICQLFQYTFFTEMKFNFIWPCLFFIALYFYNLTCYGMHKFSDDEARVSGPVKPAYTETYMSNLGNFCAMYYPNDLCVYSKEREFTLGCIDGPGKYESIRKMYKHMEPEKKVPHDDYLRS